VPGLYVARKIRLPHTTRTQATMELYLHRNGEQVGPYNEDQISSMITNGALSRDDIVWHDGLIEWQPLHAVFSLPPPLAPPPLSHHPVQPQTPNQPPVVVIQKKSGCLSTGLIVVGVIVIGSIGLSVLGLIAGSSAIKESAAKSSSGDGDPREKSPRELKEEVRDQIELDWSWGKSGFGNIMEANFTITNSSPYDIKDIEIRTIQSGKSGTKIDRNTRTIYEIIKAGETKKFEKFNMGFIHSQSESASATIMDFVVIK